MERTSDFEQLLLYMTEQAVGQRHEPGTVLYQQCEVSSEFHQVVL